MITVTTDHPVAYDSLDHIKPHGTSWDNSVWQPFNDKMFKLWPDPRLLDLGCAGGGLVRSWLVDGGFAVGIEGSDFSLNAQRAEWATIPDNLFTADCSRPFIVEWNHNPLWFDVVTAWEFFEHIPEDRVGGVLDNVVNHLADGGALVVSISSVGFPHEHHVTVKPAEWWVDFFGAHGFDQDEGLRDYIDPDWVRGPITGVEGSLCTAFRYVG